MTAFGNLNSIVRMVFALWALLLCLVGIVIAVRSFVGKRFVFFGISLVLFAPAFFFWQSIFDLSLLRQEKISQISQATAAVSETALVWYIVIFGVLTASYALLFALDLRRGRTTITLNSIKKYLDEIPCGVCCFRKSGQVVFANGCMNDLCFSLTGGALLNGGAFADVVKDGIIEIDGKVWRFSLRDIEIRDDTLRELIAFDITGEYAKTQALEKDKTELSRLNRELKEYNRNIDEIVRRQEILQAKVNIHDEMNKLMLSTVSVGSENAAELDRIFSLWEQNALLLCMEASKTEDGKAASKIEEVARALKIELVYDGTLPDEMTTERKNLFYSALQEAVINAAKHAKAKELRVKIKRTGETVCCSFENAGDVKAGEVKFTGGLSSLARLAKSHGAAVTAVAEKTFTLTLLIPARNQPIG